MQLKEGVQSAASFCLCSTTLVTSIFLVARGLLQHRMLCPHPLRQGKQEDRALRMSGKEKHSHESPVDFRLHLKGHRCVSCPPRAAKEN